MCSFRQVMNPAQNTTAQFATRDGFVFLEGRVFERQVDTAYDGIARKVDPVRAAQKVDPVRVAFRDVWQVPVQSPAAWRLGWRYGKKP